MTPAAPDPVRTRALARVGQTLRGKLRIDALMGIGGMAAVYAATHRNGSRVAVKILHEHASVDAEVRRLFRREGLAANKVEHPAVIRVLDDDVTEDGCAFLIMPLLVGETLQRRWTRLNRKLDAVEVLSIAHVVLEALGAAHEKGVIHRDIKPDNLFITTHGELRVLDFGVARVLEHPEMTSVTRAGRAVGTPAFMSPEQALGRTGEIDAQSDLWSLGATMFVCLGGENVHVADTSAELLVRAATSRARSLGDVVPGLPPSLVALVDTALRFEKVARWTSALAMREAVDEVYRELQHAPFPTEAWFAPAPIAGEQPPPARFATDQHSLVTRPHQAQAAPPAPSRARLIWGATIGATVIGLAALVVNRVETAVDAPLPRQISSSASAAETAFAAGLQAWRDASLSDSREHLLEAVKSDPTMARASFLLALESLWADEDARQNFQQAWKYRTQLDAPDRALVEAYAPAFEAAPNLAEARSRLSTVCAQYRTSPLCAYALSGVDLRSGRLDDVAEDVEALTRTDRTLAVGLQREAIALAYKGDVAGTRAALAECLERSPYSTDCLSNLSGLEANEGNCSASEALARRLIAAKPRSTDAFQYLANGLIGRGASLAAAREALAQGWAVAGSVRPAREAEQTAQLELLSGRFDLALAAARNWEEAIATSEDEELHAQQVSFLTAALLEIGDRNTAILAIDDFVAKRAAWERSAYFDHSILPLRIQYVTGSIGRPQFLQERNDWLQSEAARPSLIGAPGFRWVMGYAQTSKGREDALDALRALPRYLPLPSAPTADPSLDAPTGAIYLMAGMDAEARHYLERAARACRAVDWPIHQTHAIAHLGMVLERAGDIAGACQAYATVLSRWGRDPRSVTASDARLRAERLNCSTNAADAGAPP